MRALRAAIAAVIVCPAISLGAAAQQAGAQAPAGQTPPAPVQPGSQTPEPSTPAGAPATAPAGAARTFSAPVGLLFNAVRSDRQADFEKVMAYLRAALEKSTNPTIRAQARGWRFFKAAEPGPGGTVLYVFALDPAVPGADYGLGRILAEAYPDTAQLQEIWKLYQGAVTSGGSLLNLTPIPPAPPPPLTAPGNPVPAPAPVQPTPGAAPSAPSGTAPANPTTGRP